MAAAIDFEPGRDYNNVYFLKVDAQGHSQIVRSLDTDTADKVFDIFENEVLRLVEEVRDRVDCSYAKFWGWQGDGGLCVLWDSAESKARRAAIEAAEVILDELAHINEIVKRHRVDRNLAVRIAITKGNFRYKGNDRHGSVHSADLNWCAHLEAATPTNSIAISGKVQEIMGEAAAKYTRAPGEFEGQAVYLRSLRDMSAVLADWRKKAEPLSAINIESDIPVDQLGVSGIFAQRTQLPLYTKVIEKAEERIWALGIGLGGFHADHFSALKKKLQEKAIDVRLILADPTMERLGINVIGDKTLAPIDWWDFQANQGGFNRSNAERTLQSARETNKELEAMGKGSRIDIRYSALPPSAAVMIADDTAFVSPYLRGIPNLKNVTFMVHKNSQLFDRIVDHFSNTWTDQRFVRPAV